jgi:DNA polymerase-3 subunit gamma/tau
VLEAVQQQNRMSWIVCVTAQVRELDDEVLTLVFPTEKDAAAFRPQPGVPGGVHEILRDAIHARLGVTVKFRLSVEGTPTASIPTNTASVDAIAEGLDTPAAPALDQPIAAPALDQPESRSKREFATPVEEVKTVSTDDGWNVTVIPGAGLDASSAPTLDQPEVDPIEEEAAPEDTAHAPAFGEAIVRQILGGTLIGEENTAEIDVVELDDDQPLSMIDESDR